MNGKFLIRITAAVLALMFVLIMFISVFTRADSVTDNDRMCVFDTICTSNQMGTWILNQQNASSVFIRSTDIKPTDYPYSDAVVMNSAVGATGNASITKLYNSPSNNGFKLTVNMDIRSLAPISASGERQGIGVDISLENGAELEFTLNSFSGDNGLNAVISLYYGTENSARVPVVLPFDDAMHEWSFVYTSLNKAAVLTDGVIAAEFDDIRLDEDVKNEAYVRISNIISEKTENVNYAYINRISMYDNPVITDFFLSPFASKENFAGTVTTSYKLNDDYSLILTLSDRDGNDISIKQNIPLSDTEHDFSFDAGGITSDCKIKLSLEKDGIILSQTAAYTYLYRDIKAVECTDKLTADEGCAFICNDLENIDFPDNSVWVRSYYASKKRSETGTVLNCAPQEDITESFEYPAVLNGKFAVYIGYISGSSAVCVNGTSVKMNSTYDDTENTVHEVFALCQDFSGQTLTISNIPGNLIKIAYIKFVSISDEDYSIYQSDADKNLIIDNDGFTDFCLHDINTSDDLTHIAVDSYADCFDFAAINISPFLTTELNYNSAVLNKYIGAKLDALGVSDENRPSNLYEIVAGNGLPVDYEQYMSDSYKKARSSMLALSKEGSVPSIVALSADKRGIDAYASLRMAAFYNPETQYFLNGSMFYLYPEWHQKESDLMSYYYDGYRNYITELLQELSLMDGIDGVTLDFSRYPYVIGSEQNLPEGKTAVMNEFMRNLRAVLGDSAVINLKIAVPADSYATQYGIDYQEWIRSGYINNLIVIDFEKESFYDYMPYLTLCEHNGVGFYLGITNVLGDIPDSEYLSELEYLGLYDRNTNRISPELCMQRAREAYSAGAKGVYIYNGLTPEGDGSYSKYYGRLNSLKDTEVFFRLEYPAEFVKYPVTILEKSATELFGTHEFVQPKEENDSGILPVVLIVVLSISLILFIALCISNKSTSRDRIDDALSKNAANITVSNDSNTQDINEHKAEDDYSQISGGKSSERLVDSDGIEADSQIDIENDTEVENDTGNNNNIE